MSKPVDLIGRQYGRLLVVERIGSRPQTGVWWKCLCSCGNYFETKTSALNENLKKGTVSCGCARKNWYEALSRKKKALNPRQGQINRVLRVYRGNAKRKKLPFLLSVADWYELTQQPCFYCGEPPANSSKPNNKNRHGEAFIYNGIDRVDSAIGYLLTNCVPCCKTCNIAKKDNKQSDFLDWVKKVYEHTFKDSL